MLKLYYVAFIFLCFFQGQAQSSKDLLADLYRPYRTAMGVLLQSQSLLPQDSIIIAKEQHTIETRLKRLSDSIAKANPSAGSVYFELQRLIDLVTFNQQHASLDNHLSNLYNFVAKHQTEVVDNSAQFNKVAQCIMNVLPSSLLLESEIIQHHYDIINRFYQKLDTQDWDVETRRKFFGFFVSQYSNKNNIGMAEKLYSQFEDLISREEPFETIETFALSDNIKYLNGFLQPKNRISYNYTRSLIIINPQEESLFELVYIIRTLWAFDKMHRPKYDAVILRDKNIISDEFLKAIKNNLAFSDYYIADYPSPEIDVKQDQPAYMLVNKDSKVTFQTNDIISFFKELNAPIKQKELKDEVKRKKQMVLRQRRQDSLATVPVDSTKQYSFQEENITFNLIGRWKDGLTGELNPVNSPEEGALIMEKPYLARFTVKDADVELYQFLIIVTDSKQTINITSNELYQKEVLYQNKDNAKYHKILEEIEICLQEELAYKSIIAYYPFEESDFIQKLENRKKDSINHRRAIITAIENEKIRAILKNYASQLKDQYNMML